MRCSSKPGGLAGVHEVGATADVDDGLRERLVERDEGVAVARDARLVAERLADRLAEHDRDVLDGVVRVDVGVARRAHGEVGERVLGERRQQVVEERHGGVDVTATGAVEVELELDRRLARRAAQRRRAGGSGAAHEAESSEASASRNAVVSCLGAGRHTQVMRDADVADQHALVVQSAPRLGGVVDAAEQHEVGPRLVRLVPDRLERRRDAVALRDDLVDHPEHGRRVPQRRARGRLRERAQVVRQAHEAQRVDERRVGRQVADARAGERERLAHRARDDQTLAARQQRQRGSLVARARTPGTPRRRRRCPPSRRTPPRSRRGSSACRSGCSARTGRRRRARPRRPALPRSARRP